MNPLNLFSLRTFAATAAIITLLAASGAASAQVNGRMTVGALTLTLTDLDPLDGISPSLLFTPFPYEPKPGNDLDRALIAASYHDGETGSFVRRYEAGTETLTQSYESSGVALTATLSGRDQPGTHQIEIVAFAQTDGTLTRRSTALLDTGRLPFVLSPNTAITFEIDVAVQASVTLGPEMNEGFVSDAMLRLVIGEFPGATSLRTFKGFQVGSLPEFYALRSLDTTETLSVSYSNNSDHYITGYSRFEAWAHASSGPITTIPEPGTLPMLVTGLLTVGMRYRRRAG